MKNSIVIVFLLLSFYLKGQDISYRQYTSFDGLSSSHVNDLLQDERKMIWIATNAGINRFDGYHFYHFDINNGLVDNNIQKIYKDSDNKIWLLGQSGLLCYFNKGHFISYKYNNAILKLIHYKETIDKESFFVKNDSVFFNIYNKGRFYIDTIGKTHRIKNNQSKNFIDIRTPQTTYFLSSKNKGLSLLTNSKTTLYKNIFIQDIDQYIVKRIDSSVFLAYQNKLYHITPSSIDSTIYPQRIISCSITSDTILWIGCNEGGVYKYHKKEGQEDYISWRLRSKSISSIIQDFEGSIWASSLNGGLFYMPSDLFKKIRIKDGIPNTDIKKLELSKDYLWAIVGNNTISQLSFRGIINHPLKDYSQYNITDILWDNNKLWFSFGNNIGYIKDSKIKIIVKNKQQNSSFIRGIASNNKHKIWLYNNNSFERFNIMRPSVGTEANKFNDIIINKVLPTSDDEIWLACNDGLRKYKNKTLINYNTLTPFLSNRINDLIIDKKNHDLWLSINGVGIIRIHNDTLTNINTSNGLVSNSVTSLFAYGDDVWVGTKEGISKIQLLENTQYTISNIKAKNGLLFSEINDLIVNKRYVFVATNDGIGFFSYKKLKPNLHTPPIFITSNRNDTIRYFQDKTIILPYKNNGIRINYIGINYRSMGDVQYRFRIKELNKKWTYTTNTSADYPYLPSGQYHFQVLTSNENGIWSQESAEIRIIVKNPYWISWWFVTLVIIAIWLSYIWIHTSVGKRKKDKERIKEEINEFRQMALNQQINPHFIFNALNSIQHYILQNDTKLSNKFLTKFSRLIRISLENSRNKLIRLEDEINALSLYLELESLRFKDKMKYSLYIDEEIDLLDIVVPPMLIQPFVENAIWHGIMNKDDGQQGILSIKFINKQNGILCIIKDNGVGRKKTEEMKKERNTTHKSLGTKIIQSRIDLINSLYNKKISVQYIDLYDDKKPLGTMVKIFFPLMYIKYD